MENNLIEFKTDVDKDGRRYFRAEYLKNTECNVCVGEVNYCFTGRPRLVLRKGKSVYGDQLFFDFLIDPEVEMVERPKNSRFDTIEMYLPERDGLDLIECFLKNIKEEPVD